MEGILDESKQGATFRKRLGVYTQPTIYVILGIIFACISAVIVPLFGWWMIEVINNMSLASY
jgi:hypothetical protein